MPGTSVSKIWGKLGRDNKVSLTWEPQSLHLIEKSPSREKWSPWGLGELEVTFMSSYNRTSGWGHSFQGCHLVLLNSLRVWLWLCQQFSSPPSFVLSSKSPCLCVKQQWGAWIRKLEKHILTRPHGRCVVWGQEAKFLAVRWHPQSRPHHQVRCLWVSSALKLWVDSQEVGNVSYQQIIQACLDVA